MSSKRQQIVDKVKERFALIRIANGYLTEAGANLKEWQTTALEDDELPATNIFDGKEKASIKDKNSGTYTALLQITVNFVFREADLTPAAARNALADASKAIGVDPKWGGLARHTLPDSEEVVMDPKSQKLAGARITFIVEYSRKPWE